MTQLLISVKNTDEAILALEAKVDMIDLKDPAVGALGALGLDITREIVLIVNGQRLVSATVGEGHKTVGALVNDIETRHQLGVSIIKLAFSELFKAPNFIAEILRLVEQNIKLVAVFFAEETIDLTSLSKLKQMGFYGAMIDTKGKEHSLITQQSIDFLHKFTLACKENGLLSGLAGSLRLNQLIYLREIEPSFIGLRGGVCDNFIRKSALSYRKVREASSLLHLHNEHGREVEESLLSTLHT
jgi:dihydroneopterin aldolase